MGWRECIVQEDEFRYTFSPRASSGRVIAHLSEDLLEGVGEETFQQAVDAAMIPGVLEVHLMPDVHVGAGYPVGCVLVTEGTIVLAASGYDISCGMVAVRFPKLRADCLVDPFERRRWIQEVEARMATSVGSHRGTRARVYKEDLVERVFYEGAQALGVSPEVCERRAFTVPRRLDFDALIEARKNAAVQLGSLGGGNHFIELLCEETSGEVWAMVHTGSRGFGWKVADSFFRRAAELRGLPVAQRERAYLLPGEALREEYLLWHGAAANYASANRWAIVEQIREATGDVFGDDGVPFYEISHNLVQPEPCAGRGGPQVWVHRKGATRAFCAEHPGLPKGAPAHPVLIPGSMFSGAAVLLPRAGALSWASSVNHGSGRLLGRRQAKRDLAALQGDVNNEMGNVVRRFGDVRVEGVLSNHRQIPLDECHHAYKSLEDVLDVVERDNAAEIVYRLWPVANVKGSD